FGVDRANHAEHVARLLLLRLLVGSEVVRRQRLTFVTDVTIAAAYAEGAREAAHRIEQRANGNVFREDLEILQLLRRKLRLCTVSGENDDCSGDEESAHGGSVIWDEP